MLELSTILTKEKWKILMGYPFFTALLKSHDWGASGIEEKLGKPTDKNSFYREFLNKGFTNDELQLLIHTIQFGGINIYDMVEIGEVDGRKVAKHALEIIATNGLPGYVSYLVKNGVFVRRPNKKYVEALLEQWIKEGYITSEELKKALKYRTSIEPKIQNAIRRLKNSLPALIKQIGDRIIKAGLLKYQPIIKESYTVSELEKILYEAQTLAKKGGEGVIFLCNIQEGNLLSSSVGYPRFPRFLGELEKSESTKWVKWREKVKWMEKLRLSKKRIDGSLPLLKGIRSYFDFSAGALLDVKTKKSKDYYTSDEEHTNDYIFDQLNIDLIDSSTKGIDIFMERNLRYSLLPKGSEGPWWDARLYPCRTKQFSEVLYLYIHRTDYCAGSYDRHFLLVGNSFKQLFDKIRDLQVKRLLLPP